MDSFLPGYSEDVTSLLNTFNKRPHFVMAERTMGAREDLDISCPVSWASTGFIRNPIALHLHIQLSHLPYPWFPNNTVQYDGYNILDLVCILLIR